MRRLAINLSSLAPVMDVIDDDIIEVDSDEEINSELEAIGKYQADRYHKMKKEVNEKMDFHKVNLIRKWDEQKDILDHLALKEIRAEFEETHKKLRFMVSEWERRKFSDRLSDELVNIIGRKADDYIDAYRKMDEEKGRKQQFRGRKTCKWKSIKERRKEQSLLGLCLFPTASSNLTFSPGMKNIASPLEVLSLAS